MPPLKYFVPNSFTAASLLIGLASIVLSAQGGPGDFELAAWMILWATLLDKADGATARLCKATSDFGVQFDSFADFVAFGMAPAALIYFRLMATGHYLGWHKWALMLSAGLYVLALAVRLARFNITAGSSDDVFIGIPGTLMGAVVASGYLTWDKYHLAIDVLKLSPAYLLIGALLMVSNVRLPKLKVRKSRAFNVVQFSNVAVAYVVGPLMLWPEYLFSLAAGYTIVGVTWCWLRPPQSQDEATEQLAT